jgi:hypothetical protein
MKIKQSETKSIKRSEIKEAPYNPRKKDKKVVDALIKNFKKVGYLGGIVVNARTGNLVGGHKRIEAMDIVFKYPANDYDVKVEVIDVDEKTEKEQNIFLNNKRVQGDMDYQLLSEILPELELENTGLEQYDLELCQAINPKFEFGDNKEIVEGFQELKQDNKESIKKLKADIKKNIMKDKQQSYFVVSFESVEDKGQFLEGMGINGNTTFVDAELFKQKLSDYE